MEVIYRSPLCPDYLKDEILSDLKSRGLLKKGDDMPETVRYYPALTRVDMVKFKKVMAKSAIAEYLKADLSDYKHKRESSGFIRDKEFTKDHLPQEHEKLEVK